MHSGYARRANPASAYYEVNLKQVHSEDKPAMPVMTFEFINCKTLESGVREHGYR